MSIITPTTELEAVNECLENIGQAPVSTISGDLGVDTQIALNFVRKVSRAVQSMGWAWNIEKDFPLRPSGDGNIYVPVNTLSIRSTGKDAHRDIIQRGSIVYDRDNRSYTFTEEILFEITLGLSFENLPETARRYMALRAARLFQDRIEGSADQADFEDEQTAWATLRADQIRIEGSNALTNNVTTASTLRRHAFR